MWQRTEVITLATSRRGGRRGGRGGGISAGQKRKFIWARVNGSAVVDDTQGICVDLLEPFRALYGSDLVGVTVDRVRGTIFWNTENVVVSGITCVSAIRTESQLNLSEEEGPLAAKHDDWMMYDTTILDDNSPGWYLVDRRPIDVRSSRKMEEVGETLMLAFEHDAAATALGVKYVLSVGFKLP